MKNKTRYGIPQSNPAVYLIDTVNNKVSVALSEKIDICSKCSQTKMVNATILNNGEELSTCYMCPECINNIHLLGMNQQKNG